MANVSGRQVLNNMIIQTSTGTVFMQEEEPTEFREGDIWFKLVNGKATQAYNAKGGVWVEVSFESSIIAENIVGKIITGGEINGTTIRGSSFINKFNVGVGDNQFIKGDTTVEDGEIEQNSTLSKEVDGIEEILSKSNILLKAGQYSAMSETYKDGMLTGASSANLVGGLLNLTSTDTVKSHVGTLSAELLESMSSIKRKIVTPPDNANFKNARLEYSRFGQIVTVAIKFDRITSAGWNHLSQIPDGYKPNSYIDASTFLASTGNRGSFAAVYCDTTNNFIYIPSVPSTATNTESYQGSVTYFTNQSWKLA